MIRCLGTLLWTHEEIIIKKILKIKKKMVCFVGTKMLEDIAENLGLYSTVNCQYKVLRFRWI